MSPSYLNLSKVHAWSLIRRRKHSPHLVPSSSTSSIISDDSDPVAPSVRRRRQWQRPFDYLRSSPSRLRRAISEVEHLQDQIRTLYNSHGIANEDLDLVIDLSSQLGILFLAATNVDDKQMSNLEIKSFFDIMKKLEKLYTELLSRGVTALNDSDVLDHLKFIQYELMQRCTLLSQESTTSEVGPLTEDEQVTTPYRLIFASVPSKPPKPSSSRRISLALDASRMCKDSIGQIPLAGGFLAFGFGVTTFVLEKYKVKNEKRQDAHSRLKNVAKQLDSIFLRLQNQGTIKGLQKEGQIVAGPERLLLKDELLTFERHIKEATFLSRKIMDISTKNFDDIYDRIVVLSTTVSAFQTDICSLVTSTPKSPPQNFSQHEVTSIVAVSIFFS